MAASLVALVARRSSDWADAPGIAAQAASLRTRLVELADEDVTAYGAALEALSAAQDAGGSRDRLLGVALERAADVPLRIAAASADVAALGALAAVEGRAPLRPDAATGTLLAEAACRAAVRLVEENLTTLEGDARLDEAHRLATAAAAARAAALGAPQP
jgi:formiminotetrahydrofolate cyclodeaminase